ncbi:MAG TPA: hypothetical protein VFA11_08785 [Acidimicrobiales bacterium]|nr:hypothetical protein [Acidimicrobiales bacterium]
MRIRALSVFEGVVYHCYAVTDDNPCRPTLEVDARTGPGDLDAGPLMVTWGDYVRMAGLERAEQCVEELRRRNRLVTHLGVVHVSFPTWTPVADD